MTLALQVHSGPRTRLHLRERGLAPSDVRVVPAAAGGPKGLVLNPLDRFNFGHWPAATTQSAHLIGATIGAWRLVHGQRLPGRSRRRVGAIGRRQHRPGLPARP